MLERKQMGEIIRWGSADVAKPRNLDPLEKIAWERHQLRLQEQAQTRQEQCWKCGRRPVAWVLGVHFDNKGEKAAPLVHAQISADDYPGPVPGFCAICLFAVKELAEAVYHDRPEIRWGARPTRWWVQMTDGTIYGGECEELKPENLPRLLPSSR